jgi:hypothetical protein
MRRFTSFFFLATLFYFAPALASSHLTEKQLEFLKGYVGKTYWVVAHEGKMPLFFSAPSSAAPSFHATGRESFQITEIVGISNQRPYYKTQFESGRQGYVSVDSFLGELNLTVLTQDPDMGQKRRAAKENEEEKDRGSWIRAQRWPEPMKEAAIKRKAVLGMNMKETRVALGKPTRKVRIANNQLIGDQEQWIYDNGVVLTFTNGLITRMQTLEAKEK